jgi:hypothetical protein
MAEALLKKNKKISRKKKHPRWLSCPKNLMGSAFWEMSTVPKNKKIGY